MDTCRLYQHGYGVLQVFLEGLQEGGTYGSVHDAVVGAEGYGHYVGNAEAFALAYHHFLDAANSQDGAVRGVDDGGKMIDVHHTQVGDGEGVAGTAVARRRRRKEKEKEKEVGRVSV